MQGIQGIGSSAHLKQDQEATPYALMSPPARAPSKLERRPQALPAGGGRRAGRERIQSARACNQHGAHCCPLNHGPSSSWPLPAPNPQLQPQPLRSAATCMNAARPSCRSWLSAGLWM